MAKVTFDKNGLAKSSGTLMVYNFSSMTGEFTGHAAEFVPQGVGLSACACTDAPPQIKAGSVAVYRDGDWLSVADHRGETVCSFTAEKSAPISKVNSVTQPWQMQLLPGFITEVDKTSLTAWMKYIQAIQVTDLSNAPDISWPVKPA